MWTAAAWASNWLAAGTSPPGRHQRVASVKAPSLPPVASCKYLTHFPVEPNSHPGALAAAHTHHWTQNRWTTLPERFRQAGFLTLGVGKLFHDGGGGCSIPTPTCGPGEPSFADRPSWTNCTAQYPSFDLYVHPSRFAILILPSLYYTATTPIISPPPLIPPFRSTYTFHLSSYMIVPMP